MFKKILFLTVVLFASYSNFAEADLLKNQVFNSNGYQRTYDVYLPNNNSRNLKPLVLLLHGHFGNADVMTGESNKKSPYKVWRTIADREDWVLLIPDGEFGSDNHRGWNDCRANTTTNPETDDVEFLNSLIQSISEKYPIDSDRIYAHGTSNGGNMVFRLAMESGANFRAIAAVVAAMPEKSECFETKVPISVLVMNGTNDPILPYSGGKIGRPRAQNKGRGSVSSTPDTIKYWVNNNGIRSQPRVTILPNRVRRDRSTVQVEHYSGGINNTEVILYKVRGGGHTEPSYREQYGKLFKIIVGNQNKDIEMAEEVWKFFERNR